MADLSDAEAALVTLIAAAAYPNGTAQPSAVGNPVRIYPGWPTPSLDIDLAVSPESVTPLHISVFATGAERNTTRFAAGWLPLAIPATTLTVSTTDTQATIGGAVSVPQNIGVVVNNKAYLYAVQASDTLTSIATAIATLAKADVPAASSTGPTITIPGAVHLSGRVGSVGTAVKEIRRQERQFMVTVWANSNANRKAAAALVDQALSSIRSVTYPDGSVGRIVYVRSADNDMGQKANLYRRDIVFSVEYATTVTQSVAQMLALTETVAPTAANGGQLGTIATITQ